MSKTIRFVSETTLKLTNLVAEGKITVEVAHELVDVMKANGFAENHNEFFDAIKLLIEKVVTTKEDF
jgi:hypothetical protein